MLSSPVPQYCATWPL